MAEQGEGVQELEHEIRRGKEIRVLATFGKAGIGNGEVEGDEVDRKGGSDGQIEDGADPGQVYWRGAEGDQDSSGCKEASEVEHGDHVAGSHQRDEE